MIFENKLENSSAVMSKPAWAHQTAKHVSLDNIGDFSEPSCFHHLISQLECMRQWSLTLLRMWRVSPSFMVSSSSFVPSKANVTLQYSFAEETENGVLRIHRQKHKTELNILQFHTLIYCSCQKRETSDVISQLPNTQTTHGFKFSYFRFIIFEKNKCCLSTYTF